MSKLKVHEIIAVVDTDTYETHFYCSCGYAQHFPIDQKMIEDHINYEKDQARVRLHVGVGDIVVLDNVMGSRFGGEGVNILHLAKVLSIQRRFGYCYDDPLLKVSYLDTDSLEQHRAFEATMRESNPEYKSESMHPYIAYGYVRDVIKKSTPGPKMLPFNALKRDRYTPKPVYKKNRMEGSIPSLVDEILRDTNLPIPVGLDETRIWKLFWKQRPGLILAARYPGISGYIVVNRKKFRSWVLHNFMKFMLTAKEMNKTHREADDAYQKEWEQDLYDEPEAVVEMSEEDQREYEIENREYEIENREYEIENREYAAALDSYY